MASVQQDPKYLSTFHRLIKTISFSFHSPVGTLTALRHSFPYPVAYSQPCHCSPGFLSDDSYGLESVKTLTCHVYIVNFLSFRWVARSNSEAGSQELRKKSVFPGLRWRSPLSIRRSRRRRLARSMQRRESSTWMNVASTMKVPRGCGARKWSNKLLRYVSITSYRILHDPCIMLVIVTLLTHRDPLIYDGNSFLRLLGSDI